jgi:NADH dehydrogenase
MAVRIAITGANSAVGRALLCLPELRERGVAAVACVRSESAESQLPPLPDGCRCARIDYDDRATLTAALDGCDALVHLPGVLIERPGSSYERANVETTTAIVAAAAAARPKLVLVSAIGADEKSGNRYYRTKGAAERRVRDSGLAWTILRAPLVLGPGTEGSAALLAHAKAGTARLLGGGRHLQQPLFVDDLARAALRATRPGVADGRTLDLVGPESVPNRVLVERTAAALGRSVRIGSAPIALLRLVAGLRHRITGSGFSPDAIDVITADTDLPTGAATELDLKLTPIDAMIARMVGTPGAA